MLQLTNQRTMTRCLARRGMPTDVAARILNHVNGGGSNSGVNGVYQRYDFLAERQKAASSEVAYLLRTEIGEFGGLERFHPGDRSSVDRPHLARSHRYLLRSLCA